MDDKTRALLAFARKLTEMPSMVDREDIEKLSKTGWDEKAVWEITALVSLFNFSGRLEVASGLPHDEIPAEAKFPEGTNNG